MKSIVRLLLSNTSLMVVSVQAVLPPHNPPWPPTYNMSESLISMNFNYSGMSTFGASFGIISYDWSNAKQIWAANKPMNCEELLYEQAVLTKQKQSSSKSSNQHVFVYRNIVKALPWFSTVREKLNDPAYAGFFLPFSTKKKDNYHVPPCARENPSHCSYTLYHDQLQTPQVPTASDPFPDGSCTDGYCDCGPNIPCGEYLFDHRNGTMLRDFIVNQVVLGALQKSETTNETIVDGLFLDDFWCSTLLCEETKNTTPGCPCNDPVQGATEIDAHQQEDMGLSDEDIANITKEWDITMTAVQQALLLNHSAYTWSLMAGQENANAWPNFLRRDSCRDTLRFACHRNTQWQQLPMLFGFTVSTGNGTMTQLHQDLAFFLLVRGPYAWAGWGIWGMSWPPSVPIPTMLTDHDYGTPLGVCFEWAPGVFVREWTNAQVELDCNTFTARIDHY